jgi:alpha-N-arabinofuranosidase
MGCGGNMRPEHYADVYRQFVTYMSDWNNSDRIFRIASGASDDDYNWTEVMMRDIPAKMIDAVGVHHYSVIDWSHKGSAPIFQKNNILLPCKSDANGRNW